MNFYYLEEAVRTEDTGDEYPQILKMSKQQDYLDDDGVYVFSRIPLPQTKPDLKYLILEKNAKRSDLLSTVMLRLTGFLVNDKLKSILSKYILPEHRFYEAFVKDFKNKEHIYWWLQMIISTPDFIDFEASNFNIISNGLRKETCVDSFASYKQIRSSLSENENLEFDKIKLSKHFLDAPLDIFRIREFSVYWIISERLKDDIILSGITGIKIRPIENIIT